MNNTGNEMVTLTLTVEQARVLMEVGAILGQKLDDLSREDALYEEALKYGRSVKTLGTSQLQRVFKIGYNRAARLIVRMAESGDLPSDRLKD